MSGMQLSIHTCSHLNIRAGNIKGCKYVKVITLRHMDEDFMIKLIEKSFDAF